MTGIYFLLDEFGRVIYIGQTTDFTARLRSHKDKPYDSFRFIPCKESDLRYYETRWLNKFKPSLNKTIPYFGEWYITTLRIPNKVYWMLKKRAKAQNRSLNAQIVHEVERNDIEFPSILGRPQSAVFKVSGLK